MPEFYYKAKRGPSELVDGSVEADNLDNAIEKVIKLGLSPIDVTSELPTKTDRAPQKIRTQTFNFSQRVKKSDIGPFTRQLCDLVESGVPLLQSLNLIFRQTSNPAFKDMIEKMTSFVRDGGTLSDAMAQHGDVFSRLYVSMVRSGEISGNLDLILNRLAEFHDKDLEIRNKVRSSLIYPSLMLAVGAVTIFVLLTFVIPRLTTMFEDLAQTMPLPTVILVNISGFLERFWWIIVLLSGFGGFYFKNFINSPEGKLWFDGIKIRLPVFGEFIKDVEIGRFARTLATLLESGVVIVSALQSVWTVLDNEVIKRDVRMASEDVSAGSSLSVALKKSRYFPESAMNMVVVGEESGRLEQSLHKLADVYERRSDQSIKTVTSLIEPILIVFIGSVVGFIVIAMLLPIFRMNLIIQ